MRNTLITGGTENGGRSPVAQTFFGLNDFGSFVDADAIGDLTREIMFSIAFAFFLVTTNTQMPPEGPTGGFVLPSGFDCNQLASWHRFRYDVLR